MNLKKAKTLLRKIDVLMTTIAEDDQVSRLEKDLLLSYVKNLYDSLLQESEMVSYPSPITKTTTNQVTAPPPPIVPEQKVPDLPKIESTKVEIPAINEIPPINSELEAIKEEVVIPEPKVVETPIVEEKVMKTPIIEKEIEAPAPIIKKVEKINTPVVNSSIAAIFDIEESNDLSGKLSARPISDLTKSMGLNEKIFTVKELFGNENDIFTKTMSTLNDFNSFEEAKNYLVSNVADKYDWASDGKIKKAQTFIKLIKRRYN